MNEPFDSNPLNFKILDLLLKGTDQYEERSLNSISISSELPIFHIIKYNSFKCPIFDIKEEEGKTNLGEEEKKTDAQNILKKAIQSENIQKNPVVKFLSQKFIKQKRGRKKKCTNKKIHDKYTIDNVLRKLQVNYLTFIVSYINEILEILGYKEKFFNLDYSIKKDINKKNVRFLNKQNIGEIICIQKSHKYKINKESNTNIYEKIKQKNDKVLTKIFSENYAELFWKIYYQNCKTINLKEYGLEKEICLSQKVKMFEDLLKQSKDSETSIEQYKQQLINCAELNIKLINQK